MVLRKPASQRNIGVDRIVNSVGRTGSQKLGSDWVGAAQQVGDGHVIFGFQPAVAVAEPDDLPGNVGIVAAAGVPDSSIDQHGAAWFDAKRFCAGGVGQSVFGAIELVVEVRTRHNQCVASSGF